MTCHTMPKKQVPARLDTEILEALRLAAESSKVSIAKYLEDLLVVNLKSSGRLPMDFSPARPQWGGDRKSKAKQTEVSTDDELN